MRAGRPRRSVVLVGLVALALGRLPQHGHLVPPLHLRLRRGRAGAHPPRWTGRAGRGVRAGRRRAAAALLGDDLLAAWLVGSGALGGVSAQSDVDVVAVCATDPPGERQAVAAALGELAMAWPLRGLELVLYPRTAVAIPARRPRFAINLNAGPRMPFHVSFDPADEPAHWFVLDLAILRAHGRTLTGPPPAELVGPIPAAGSWRRCATPWPGTRPTSPPCSSRSSTPAAAGATPRRTSGAPRRTPPPGPFARRRPATVSAALAIRHGDLAHSLDPARVRAFQDQVLEAVERAPG